MFPTLASTGNWRKDLENLAKFKKDIDEAVADMPTTRPYFDRKFRQAVEQMAGGIANGAVNEFHAGRKVFEQKAKKFFDAEQQERARWDLPRLESEKTALRSRIEEATKANNPFAGRGDVEKDLWAVYHEAMAGDLPRQRACAEVFAGIREMDLPGQTVGGNQLRHAAGQYVARAKEALQEVHVTDEMRAAMVEAGEAQLVLFNAHRELERAGAGIGVNVAGIWEAAHPLSKAYHEVAFDGSGQVVELLDPSGPEISGVDMSHLEYDLGGV